MSSRSIKKRTGVKKGGKLPGVLAMLGLLFVMMCALLYAGTTMVISWFDDLPDYHSPDAFNPSMPTYVYASDRKTVLARFQLEYREPVEMNQINPMAVKATIATEDARFYEHSGIDYMGVIRALVHNFTGGSLEGGSTITQQFVRNTILVDEMDDISFKRKAREAYIAKQVEDIYSKDEILLMYMNTINYGSGAHGIEAAARRYFSKSAADLTLSEAALIAGIPQSPTYNDPILYPTHALERRSYVLERMLDEHMITAEEFSAAKNEPLGLNPTDFSKDGIIAYPYFTTYVRSLLYNNYSLSESDILKGGLKVYTTLDVNKQEAAEDACQMKRDAMGNGSMEVAMAVVDPDTGNIQAIVGGADYDESQVNIATGQGGFGRPCGSVFKTFTMVTAIKKQIDPNSTYLDCSSPATIDGYTLENYGNTGYGTKSIAGAFAVSSNTGFVRLISSIGVSDVAQTAYDLGVTTDLEEDVAGAALTLGVQNVTPLDLANSVATIANGGVHHDACAITTIEDGDGNVIVDDSDPEKRAKRVLTPEQAHAAQEVMKGVVRGGTGGDAAVPNGQPVAGKTGTSEDYKDISFVGITPFAAASIWVGDPSNELSVPAGSCGDVFRNYVSKIMDSEGIAVRDFDYADNPPYIVYSDSYYHVYDYGTYSAIMEEQRRRQQAEEEARKRREEEQRRQEGASSSRDGGNGGGQAGAGAGDDD